MTLIGILTGLGVGFLQRSGSELDLALAVVRDEVRVAGLTARTRGMPTAVLLDPGRDGAPATVRSRVLEPVGRWGFEERYEGDPRLLPDVIGGVPEPGRFGQARRGVEGEPVLSLGIDQSLVNTLFDLREGFALHVDLLLDAREPMVVARLDQNLVVSLDDELYCEVKAVMRDGDAAAGSVEIRSAFPLRLHRWTTLAVAHDREHLVLWVDGREAARTPMAASLYQTDNDTFTVSPGDTPVFGLVDEVRLLAYAYTAEQVLPSEVELLTQFSRIEFGGDGRVAEPVTFELVLGDRREAFRVTPGGTVE